MLWFSETVVEKEIDYTECDAARFTNTENGTNNEPWVNNNPSGKCHELVKHPNNETCTCKTEGLLTFELEEMEGSVYVYYGLTNFYQNHRRYVKSRSDGQLQGDVEKDIKGSDCDPFDVVDTADGEKKYIPCGAIANSMFSDDITLSYTASNNQATPVKLINTGIAWESDKRYKFKNPEGNLTQGEK